MKKIISLTITVIILLSTLFSFVSFANAELENGLQSEAYIVTDAATGQILYAKNHEKQETLSGITKVMTAAISLEKLELTQMRRQRSPRSETMLCRETR